MIGVVSVGLGNTASVLYALQRLRLPARMLQRPADFEGIDRVILPGVGAFDAGMEALRASGLLPILSDYVLDRRVPFLGICLGMHLLVRCSEEGSLSGLGWIEAEVKKLHGGNEPSVRCPHIGWNNVTWHGIHPLLTDIPNSAEYYFAHSYRMHCDDAMIIAHTAHEEPFPAIVQSNNLFGVQFHPEKSHAHGVRLLRNFTLLPSCCVPALSLASSSPAQAW